MYYPNSIEKFREIIKKDYPDAESKDSMDDIPSYLLWMLDEIEVMDDSKKAGRWLGYVIGRAEALGLMENEESRNIVREDVKNGFD